MRIVRRLSTRQEVGQIRTLAWPITVHVALGRCHVLNDRHGSLKRRAKQRDVATRRPGLRDSRGWMDLDRPSRLGERGCSSLEVRA